MLEGITFADFGLGFAKWVMVATPIAAIIGFMPRSKARSVLVCLWALLPVWIEFVCLLSLPIGLAQFMGVMLILALPSWAGLSAMTFAAVVRLRDFSGGNGYGDGK